MYEVVDSVESTVVVVEVAMVVMIDVGIVLSL
jgi:hypothetical protein